MIVPASKKESCNPRIVTTGIKAFLNACFQSAAFLLRPFARAVLTKSSRMVSKTAERVTLAKIAACGKAREIALLAHATAEGIKVVSKAISHEGGRSAVKLNLVEQFIEEVGHITSSAEVAVVPKDLANIKGMFEGFKNIAASKEL